MKRGTLCVTLLLLGCTTHTAQFTSQDTRSLDGQCIRRQLLLPVRVNYSGRLMIVA